MLPTSLRLNTGRILACVSFLAFLWGLSGCSSSRAPKLEELAAFSFKSGYELAVLQDTLLARHGRGERLSEAELAALRGNAWIATAKHLAPGNLVLRQWALIDMASGEPENAARILEMMELLAPDSGSGVRVWAEGYSYWGYVRGPLALWTATFAHDAAASRVRFILDAVDSGFARTAYARDGTWYPAPFGDLREEPLQEPALGIRRAMPPPGPVSTAFVTVTFTDDGARYRVVANPLGLNTHVPVDARVVEVRDGVSAGLRFYEGYDRKYADAREESADLLRPERVASITRLGLMKRFRD
jgi:hypothetical protein